MDTPKPKNIPEYIGSFPPEVQEKLEEVYLAIRLAAPEAEEKISYSIPAFTLHGPLIYFAAYKNHIGLYGFPVKNEAFKEDLSAYKLGNGSVQFPFDKPMPLDLIARIVKFRVTENRNSLKKK